MATGWTENRRRYRQYKACTERLPANYHTAIDALEQYLEFFGPGKSDSLPAPSTAPPDKTSRLDPGGRNLTAGTARSLSGRGGQRTCFAWENENACSV